MQYPPELRIRTISLSSPPRVNFRYLRAAKGFLASGDGFTRCDSKTIKNKVMLVWDNTLEDNFKKVCMLLDIYGMQAWS